MALQISSTIHKYRPALERYEGLYKKLHANPELSTFEAETAAAIASFIKNQISSDFDLRTHIGGHGLAAILSNGHGPKVLLRADMDALPVEEKTGLPYASTKRMKDIEGIERPVMHACGHDIHMTSLLAAAETLYKSRDCWSGTLILVFQPAEERGTGAQAMVDDGLYDEKRHGVPVPDVCLGGHVVSWRAGTLGTRKGLVATSADSMRVTLHGSGGHASMPDRIIDPVVMAAHTIIRLQGIVSREISPADHAVVTVASVQAGDAENVVVNDARLAIDVRATNQPTRDKILKSVDRILKAESIASQAVKEPTVKITRSFPFTINDEAVTARLESTISSHFPPTAATIPADGVHYNCKCEIIPASEDFSILGTAVGAPNCFFLYGGTDPKLWDQAEEKGTLSRDIPVNHSSLFAPVIQPTLRVAVDAYSVAALTWLTGEMSNGSA